MNAQQANSILDKLRDWAPTALGAVLVWIGLDALHEIKATRAQVEGIRTQSALHEYRIDVHDSQISDLQRRTSSNTD